MIEKIRKFNSFVWKKWYIIIPLTVLFFFVFGFVKEYSSVMRLNEQISNTPEMYPEEYNEIMTNVYDGFSKKRIIEFSIESGITNAIFFPSIIFYPIFLSTMLFSESKKKKIIGIIFTSLTILAVIGCINFIINLEIPV